MKKSSLIYALFFLFICTGIHAQKFDIDEFHIPEGLNLSDSEYERLSKTGNQLREKLLADLLAEGYDVISPRRSKIRLERVGIDDIKVDYDSEANRVIFGKLLAVGSYITINAYLYNSENGIRSSHEPLVKTILNRQSHELNNAEEINDAVREIIKGLSLDLSNEEEARKQAEELERKKGEQLEPEQKKKEEPIASDKSIKSCSKVPGVSLVVAGGLMGGAGFYFRNRAIKIYDDEYREIVGELGDRDKLEEARRPNRTAHIIGAGGILTAGIGAYLWAKCSKKQKNSKGIGNVQITPHIEYNTMINTNDVTARISFNF